MQAYCVKCRKKVEIKESKGYQNEKQTSCDSRCMPEVRD
jgi:hypothetical protein